MKNKTTITALAAVALFTLAGCSAPTQKMKTPDGRDGAVVNCDGSLGSWATCYEEAMKECKGSYDVINQNETSTPTAYGPMVRRHLVVACKGSKS